MGMTFFERLRALDLARHPFRRVRCGGDDGDKAVAVRDALLDLRPEFLIRPNGADIVEHFVKAGGTEERFHFRDITVIGSAVGNERAAHGTVFGIRNLAPNDGLPSRPAG